MKRYMVFCFLSMTSCLQAAADKSLEWGWKKTPPDPLWVQVVALKNVARVRALLSQGTFQGADVNYRTQKTSITPVMLAAQSGDLPMIRCLVEEFGALPHVGAPDGFDAYLFAVQKGHAEVVRYLANLPGANVHRKVDWGDNAIGLAMQHEKYDLVPLLRRLGVSPNEPMVELSHALTPWMVAAQKGLTDVMRQLLSQNEVNVNLEAKDSHRKCHTTALLEAIRKGKFEAVRCLVEEFGADVNYSSDQIRLTPYQCAQDRLYLGIMDYLVEHGAQRIAAPDSEDEGPDPDDVQDA